MLTTKKIPAVIFAIQDLTATARAVTLALAEPLPFIAGSFVNVFITHEGKTLRRAFSISSTDTDHSSITISIRLNPAGAVTPLFWTDTILNTPVHVMGPLGLNTADKMSSQRIFLFGYGIGAGVVKSLAEHFVTKTNVQEIFIMTGNRSNTEIIHQDFFDALATAQPTVTVRYIVSNTTEPTPYLTGYIQDHLANLDFSNADVYVCGQEVACVALVATVKKTQPVACNFFIEGFH